MTSSEYLSPTRARTASPSSGRQSTVLRRITHIDHFPSGGEIAHVQGHVLPCEGGYWVICAQELGQFVWEVAVDRASALGGGPIGVDALPGGAA